MTDSRAPADPAQHLFGQLCSGALALVAFCLGAVALSLWVGWNGPIQALNAPYDSLWYLDRAESILAGTWLGEYDHLTLMRSPVYPLFLAATGSLGIRLHLVQQGLYLLSVLLLTGALRTVALARWRIALICLLCAFHPVAFYPARFVATEALYIPLATAMLAASLGVLGSITRTRLTFVVWLSVLAGVTPFFWHLRSEAISVAPAIAAWSVCLVWVCRRQIRVYWSRLLLAAMLPLLTTQLLGAYLAGRNAEHYGVRLIQDSWEPNMVTAFQWLTRLEPQSHRPHVPVTRQAMATAYAVSPHFAELEPYLSAHTGGKGWSKPGCEWMGVCDEVAGGWAGAAIREAAAAIGAYASPEQASAFYGAVAAELRAACTEGRIACSENPTGSKVAPPMYWTDIARIAWSLVRVTSLLITFGDLGKQIEIMDQHVADPELIARYDRVTHDQAPNAVVLSGHRARVHVAFYSVLQVVGATLVIIAVLLLAIPQTRPRLLRFWLTPRQVYVLLGVCALAFVAGRLGIIAYIDAMSFHAQLRYLLPVSPALILLLGLAIPGAAVRTHAPVAAARTPW